MTTDEPPAGARPGPLVLVADDDDGVRSITVRILERAGRRVVSATDGEEAVRRFAEDPGAFGLAVVDLHMPKLGGREALAEMRRLRADLPAILTSGYDEAQRTAERGAADRFLQKPFTAVVLLSAVREILGGP